MFNHGREQNFAKTALGLMEDVGVAATPDNFELFYAYASGENPAVTQMMAAFIHAKKPFTPEMLADLRLRCLSGARAAREMESLGGNIDALIADVLGKLESSARDTANYKRTLSAATGELGGERGPADVRKLVDGLIAATRAMEHRAKSLEGELQASSEQVSELRTKLADVRKESMTDPLTNLANRKAFDEAVRAALAAVAEEGEPVTMLLCDIDHFKMFNDTWGHQTGDQVLRLVAACLSENVKGRDTTARYGGEGGLHRFIERLAIGDVGQGIGHAFLAHVRQLCAKLRHLLGRGLQFAFQAFGAMFHGAGGGNQPVHQLAHIGGAALGAQFAGGGRQ
ncbi:MAG TPA: diguanylate cyclase, partial [Rhizomicrobium sp.]|nr:diguanylate cyclase [Rhizomicrobium sp.]